MNKLLNAYRKTPTPSARKSLQAYLDSHMMAVCMASIEDVNFLKLNEFNI